MTQKTRVGVIGLGYWGPNLARNFFELPNAELVAVADLDQQRLDRLTSRYPGVVGTNDYRDFFTMGVDAVVIATPPAAHFRIAQECLENGLHVLVEKPLTRTGEEADELVAIARRKNLRLMVGHTFEYNPAVREIRRLIEADELGEIYYIDAVRTNLGLFQLSADAMWDLAPHDISIINYLLGVEPVSVAAQGGSFVLRNYGIHDVVYMHLKYPEGVMANVRVSWLDPNKTRRLTVVGSKKMLVYDDVESLEKIRIYDKGVDAPPYTDNYGEFQMSYRYGDVNIPHIPWSEPLRMECTHFIDCIQKGETPLSDGVSGMRVVKLLEAASESLRTNGSIIELNFTLPEDVIDTTTAEPVGD
ncbi:MAG: Gfo/Idh/MocA family protein [Chloroflexota bacterium]